MDDRGEVPDLPPVAADYIVKWWLEIGPVTGDRPIDWTELSQWQENIGIVLEPWEARAIRAMSTAFLSQRDDARNPACRAPYSGETEREVQDRVTSQFAAMVSGLAGRG